jgi:hypothetical protein
MKSLLLFLLTFAPIVSVAGQKSTLAKPYDQWPLREAMHILTNPPWAQIAFDSDESGRQGEFIFVVEVRLYSALPVRQAIVRRMQLTIPYKELDVQQRANYDAEVDGLLKCPLCTTYYIVTLSSGMPDRLANTYPTTAKSIDVVALLKNLPDGEIEKRVMLSNDKGERRMAIKHAFQKRNEVVFFFPRLDGQGKPLITQSNKKFRFEIDDYVFRKELRPLKKLTYEVAPLVKDGEVIF